MKNNIETYAIAMKAINSVGRVRMYFYINGCCGLWLYRVEYMRKVRKRLMHHEGQGGSG
jgi:hypothetical protein